MEFSLVNLEYIEKRLIIAAWRFNVFIFSTLRRLMVVKTFKITLMEEFKAEASLLFAEYVSIMPEGNVMERRGFVSKTLLGFTENLIEIMYLYKDAQDFSEIDISEAKRFIAEKLDRYVEIP